MSQKALERELWQWQQVIRSHPNQPRGYVQRGMVRFKLCQIAESIQDFDQAEQLDPRLTPYLWQRGLAYYYADRFQEGAQQFTADLAVNAQDAEEALWRYLCIAQSQDIAAAQQSLPPLGKESRSILRQICDLYSDACSPESIVSAGQKSSHQDHFYGLLYVSLYYEVRKELAQAQHLMTEAVNVFQTRYKTNDYMGFLAIVHARLRGWY
ncbi:MAG: hypothetical protein Kow00121_31140 [Elainellaceae cyanobacterium]